MVFKDTPENRLRNECSELLSELNDGICIQEHHTCSVMNRVYIESYGDSIIKTIHDGTLVSANDVKELSEMRDTLLVFKKNRQ